MSDLSVGILSRESHHFAMQNEAAQEIVLVLYDNVDEQEE